MLPFGKGVTLENKESFTSGLCIYVVFGTNNLSGQKSYNDSLCGWERDAHLMHVPIISPVPCGGGIKCQTAFASSTLQVGGQLC